MKRKGNGNAIKNLINNYYFSTKQTLGNIERISNNYKIKHHGKEFVLWAIKPSGLWEFLTSNEKRKGRNYLGNCLVESDFKPMKIVELN